jgi:hypothetical protein
LNRLFSCEYVSRKWANFLGIGPMENPLLRAQHYLNVSGEMQKAAEREVDQRRRAELSDLAKQYEKLAERLLGAQQDNVAGKDQSSGRASG